jgi:hypothetical protein
MKFPPSKTATVVQTYISCSCAYLLTTRTHKIFTANIYNDSIASLGHVYVRVLSENYLVFDKLKQQKRNVKERKKDSGKEDCIITC